MAVTDLLNYQLNLGIVARAIPAVSDTISLCQLVSRKDVIAEYTFAQTRLDMVMCTNVI